MTEPLVHNLATPLKRPANFRAFYLLYVIMFALPAFLFAIVVFFGQPSALEMLKDFRLVLPPVTEYTFVVCQAAHSITFWLAAVVSIALIPWPLALFTARRSSPLRQLAVAVICMAVVQIASVILITIASYALFHPIELLLKSVEGGPP